jgi:uncharacterized membrane protein
MHSKENCGEPLEASRLIGFSDGVFAVAITLLVLDIHVPSEKTSLRELLREQGPNYLMFVVAIVMIGIKWLNHYRLFALIRHVDTIVDVLNLLLLLGICVVPFTTALIAKYMMTSRCRICVSRLRHCVDDQWLSVHSNPCLRSE